MAWSVLCEPGTWWEIFLIVHIPEVGRALGRFLILVAQPEELRALSGRAGPGERVLKHG